MVSEQQPPLIQASERPMAYQRSNPRSFVPSGLQTLNIPHREMMSRAVVHCAPKNHEDFASVSLHPLPLNALMQFPAVQEVLFEFFEEHLLVELRECLRTHLGQDLVSFGNAHIRDILVNQSHFEFGDVEVSLVRYNGHDWKALQFNRECWLMWMGFPLNY
jgi:hypothetical protein